MAPAPAPAKTPETAHVKEAPRSDNPPPAQQQTSKKPDDAPKNNQESAAKPSTTTQGPVAPPTPQTTGSGEPSKPERIGSGEPLKPERKIGSGEPLKSERKIGSGEPLKPDRKIGSGEPLAQAPDAASLARHSLAKLAVSTACERSPCRSPPPALPALQQVDQDRIIGLLMSSVKEDDKGTPTVEDHLQDIQLVERIIDQSIHVAKALPSMLELTAPICVVGDIHGQYRDLLRIFQACGAPAETQYLFLGDYVDRGPNSLEVICLLLLLKMRHPKKIHMLRGNHECSAVNAAYGFKAECEKRFQKAPSDNAVWGLTETDLRGTKLWSRFQDLFNWFPFTALVNRKILTMHGGLSPLLNSLDQLRKLERPIDPSQQGLHVDLLWSDPDHQMSTGETDPEWRPSTRGISHFFNANVVKKVCQRLDIDHVVRAHQVVMDGYEFFANRKLVTIFSAPNYCGEYHNSAAILKLSESLEMKFEILKPLQGAPANKEADIDDELAKMDEKLSGESV